MNGALRTAVLFYLRARVQRWFFALALGSLLARTAFLRMPCACARPTSFWYFVSAMPVIAFASISLMGSSALFRSVLSLRSVQLIPRARAQLVVGLLLAQVLVAALIALGVASIGAVGAVGALGLDASDAAPSPPLPWGGPIGLFAYAFGLATLAAVALQVVAGPSRLAAVVAGALLLALLARIDAVWQPQIAGAPTAALLALAGFAAWASFAAWYLRLGNIPPMTAVWKSGPRVATGPRAAGPASRSRALEAYLLGQPSLWPVCRRQLGYWLLYDGVMLLTLAAMAWFPLMHTRHAPHRDFSGLPLVLLFAIGFATNTIAGRVARHSRALWLRSGESRRALFQCGERLAWRALAFTAVPLLLIATLEWKFLPHLDMEAAYPLAVYLTLAPCGLYLGLLNFTRTVDLRFMLLALIVAQGALSAELLHGDLPDLVYAGVPLRYWLLPVLLLGLAGVLREFAARRWLAIDWLRHRPPRPNATSLGLRAAD